MENNKVILPIGGNVQGDITTCKIETAAVRKERDSAFSFTETTIYQSYDVCTRDVIETYGLDGLTFFGGTIIIVGMFLVGIILAAMAS